MQEEPGRRGWGIAGAAMLHLGLLLAVWWATKPRPEPRQEAALVYLPLRPDVVRVPSQEADPAGFRPIIAVPAVANLPVIRLDIDTAPNRRETAPGCPPRSSTDPTPERRTDCPVLVLPEALGSAIFPRPLWEKTTPEAIAAKHASELARLAARFEPAQRVPPPKWIEDKAPEFTTDNTAGVMRYEEQILRQRNLAGSGGSDE